MSAAPSFNFGAPVAFTGQPSSGAADWAREQLKLKNEQLTLKDAELTKLIGDLAVSRAEQARVTAQKTLAERARATAVDKERIARDCLQTCRDVSTHPTNSPHHTTNMSSIEELSRKNAELWEAAYNFQQKLDVVEGEKKDLRDQLAAVEDTKATLAADVEYQAAQLRTLVAEKDKAIADLANVKQDLKDEKTAAAETTERLETTYAELDQARADTEAENKAKNDAVSQVQFRQKEVEKLELELQHANDKIDALEQATEEFGELETTIEQLTNEIDGQRTEISDHDRKIHVKDARIAHLETQYQKALEGKLNAEAAAASAAPTDAPAVHTSGDTSLQDELDAASDYSDGSSYQYNELSDIAEIASTAPLYLTPAVPHVREEATQTEPVIETQIATQTEPIVEKQIATQTEPEIITITAAPKKGPSLLPVLSTLALLMCVYLFAQLQAANGYGSRDQYFSGAFGNGRYLFGVFPIGFDIGPDRLSEHITRTTSDIITAIETWAGITPTPLY
jgi:myosin heavy subunit